MPFAVLSSPLPSTTTVAVVSFRLLILILMHGLPCCHTQKRPSVCSPSLGTTEPPASHENATRLSREKFVGAPSVSERVQYAAPPPAGLLSFHLHDAKPWQPVRRQMALRRKPIQYLLIFLHSDLTLFPAFLLSTQYFFFPSVNRGSEVFGAQLPPSLSRISVFLCFVSNLNGEGHQQYTVFLTSPRKLRAALLAF